MRERGRKEGRTRKTERDGNLEGKGKGTGNKRKKRGGSRVWFFFMPAITESYGKCGQ